MTPADLASHLRGCLIVTEEDARQVCRALGGSFGLGEAASTQGGGGLAVLDWNERPLVGRTTLGGLLAALVEDMEPDWEELEP